MYKARECESNKRDDKRSKYKLKDWPCVPTWGLLALISFQNQLNSDINQTNGGTPTSHTSAHESTAVAAPFQA